MDASIRYRLCLLTAKVMSQADPTGSSNPESEYWNAVDSAAEARAEPTRRGARGGGGARRGGPHRKALQLCHQVAETLNYVLSGECDDDVLRNLYVVRVDPAPDVGQMMVTVAPLDPKGAAPPEVILARLAHASGQLRREVASSITRRKTPQLLFRVISPPAGKQEG